MNFSVRQLQAFVATARTRSFTRAAEQLHISQPGLSAMLREFEAQLNCRLFERTTRSVSPTAQGEEFLPTAIRVLKELDEAVLSLGRITSSQKRRLAVGATPVIASSILPETFALFAKLHPTVQVEVQDLDRAAIYERVQTGELDAGFGAFLTSSSTVRRRRLLESSLILISNEEKPSRTKRWKDLSGLKLLGLPPDNPIQQLVESQVRASDASAVFGTSFNQLHTLLAMVEAGAGSAILPDFVRAASARYEVAIQSLRAPAISVTFYEITRAGRPSNDLLVDFGKSLVQSIGAHNRAA